MTNKYDKYENILLEDTGLIIKNSQDVVYNRLSKNNISNLKELFISYDLNNIYYGPTNNITNRHGQLETKGIVKLLRCYYLNEDYPYDYIMDGIIDKLDIIVKNNKYKFVDIFLKMGFTFNFSVSIRDNYIGNKKIIDILKDVYKGEVNVICNNNEYYKNLKILEMILECYYRNNNNLCLKDLYKAKKNVLIKTRKQKRLIKVQKNI